MPTANSIQIRRSAARITAQMAIRYSNFFTFLSISSHISPVPIRRTPATTKSNSVQFTSSVNCMAINGMSNRSAAVSTMPVSLLFLVIINVLFPFSAVSSHSLLCGRDSAVRRLCYLIATRKSALR